MHLSFIIVPFMLSAIGGMPQAQPSQRSADLDALLKGVTEIRTPGCIVGPVAVFGDEAFPVMTGKSGAGRLPILAAARYGKGRVVLAGHGGVLLGGDSPDKTALVANVARWLCGARQTRRVLLVDMQELAPTLRSAQFEVRTGSLSDLPEALAQTDVLCLGGGSLTPANRKPLVEAIARFIENGGGYFDGIPGWGWQQLNPNLSLAEDYGGNKLTARMGLVIADGMVDPTGKEGFLADRSGLELTHAGLALKALSDHAAGVRTLDKATLSQVGLTLSNAAGAVPPDDRVLLPRLHRLAESAGESAVPTEKHPVGLDNPLGRIACVLQNIEMRRAPVSKLRAHPAAADFPGAVPADAPRVAATISVDTSTDRKSVV